MTKPKIKFIKLYDFYKELNIKYQIGCWLLLSSLAISFTTFFALFSYTAKFGVRIPFEYTDYITPVSSALGVGMYIGGFGVFYLVMLLGNIFNKVIYFLIIFTWLLIQTYFLWIIIVITGGGSLSSEYSDKIKSHYKSISKKLKDLWQLIKDFISFKGLRHPEVLDTLTTLQTHNVIILSIIVALLGGVLVSSTLSSANLVDEPLLYGRTTMAFLVCLFPLACRPTLIPWVAKAAKLGFMIIILLSFFNTAWYAEMLRFLGYGGGKLVEVNLKEPNNVKKIIKGYLVLRSSSSLFLYDCNKKTISEIPQTAIENINSKPYKMGASDWVLPPQDCINLSYRLKPARTINVAVRAMSKGGS